MSTDTKDLAGSYPSRQSLAISLPVLFLFPPRIVHITSWWKTAEGNEYSLPKCYKLSPELEKPPLWKTITGHFQLPSYPFPCLMASSLPYGVALPPLALLPSYQSNAA